MLELYWTEERKQELTEHWARYGLTLEQALALRKRARTDLFWLAKELLGYDKLTETTHREVCDFFIKKDPYTYPEFQDFAEAYKGRHHGCLLLPRDGFKSTIDLADCVQWLICWEDIRILIMTGAQNLATSFVSGSDNDEGGGFKGHFRFDRQEVEDITGKMKQKPCPKKMRDGSASMFQILFPEFCSADKGRISTWTSPARRFSHIEPTIMASSVESRLSGYHFDIIKADDVTNNDNTNTALTIRNTTKQINLHRKMLEPYGFLDKVGTLYDENDNLGVEVRLYNKAMEKGERPLTRLLLRGAMWAKPGCDKPEELMTEEDWVLWFPERLTYEFLMRERTVDYETFCTQYMNNPRMAQTVRFDRQMMLLRTYPWTTIPKEGFICQAWDTAYSTKNYADYTVGITGMFVGGRVFVLDMVRGRFNDVELPQVIAAAIYKWHPKRVGIEDSVGVRWLGREIQREMTKFRVQAPIEWVALGMGSAQKSKEFKAKPVGRLMGDGRLIFSTGCPYLEDLYAELEGFPKGAHDDIVSALTILCTHFANMADLQADQADWLANHDPKMQLEYDVIHGMGKYTRNPSSEASLAAGEDDWVNINPLADLI